MSTTCGHQVWSLPCVQTLAGEMYHKEFCRAKLSYFDMRYCLQLETGTMSYFFLLVLHCSNAANQSGSTQKQNRVLLLNFKGNSEFSEG